MLRMQLHHTEESENKIHPFSEQTKLWKDEKTGTSNISSSRARCSANNDTTSFCPKFAVFKTQSCATFRNTVRKSIFWIPAWTTEVVLDMVSEEREAGSS